MTWKHKMADVNENALLADGFESAVMGYIVNYHHPQVVVYDLDQCRDILIQRDGMTWDEADEFLSFNTLDAYVGKHGPLFMQRFPI